MPPQPQSRWRPAERAGDTELWRRATRDVAPLRPPDRARARPTSRSETPPPRRMREGPRPITNPGEVRREPPLDSLAGIDRANAERLKRGRHAIEGRLDLHGLTQAEAHRALSRFVASSQTAGRRCVLVITGRGRAGEGVLRTAVPRWLAEPGLRRHLLGIAPAQPQHGGTGALYLLLRRVRPS